jgi:hypothetical protein
MRLVKHVECIGATVNACTIYVQNPNGKRNLNDLDLDGKVRISSFQFFVSLCAEPNSQCPIYRVRTNKTKSKE